MNRGELWTVSGGTYANKPRPALIIQDAVYGLGVGHPSAADVPRDGRPTAEVDGEPGQLTGLERVCQIMVDKLTTVRRASLGQRVGRVDAKTMVAVEQSLAVFLGLGR